MVAKILDGASIAKEVCENIKASISQIIGQGERVPGLGVILVGEDPASKIYVKHKITKCHEVGIKLKSFNLSADLSQAELIKLIVNLNNDPDLDGILVQLPLPDHINQAEILETIDPKKDVDGFHPISIGRLAQGYPSFRPCTPFGIMRLLEHTQLKLRGSLAVVVGASNIVGKPMLLELLNAGCTVTVCHKYTINLAEQVKTADILIVAVGQPNLISADWVKPGAVVIDVGITRLPDDKIAGDVDFARVKEVASWITPVPGGVGPMTIAALLTNTLLAYQEAKKKLH